MSEPKPLSDVEAMKDFIRNYRDVHLGIKYMNRLRRMINLRQRSLVIDYIDLYRYNVDLARRMIEEPDKVLKSAARAIYDIVATEDPEYAAQVEEFYARVRGLPESLPIRNLRSDHIGRLVQIEGIVTRVTPIKEKMVKAAYRHIIGDERCDGEVFLYPEEGEIEDVIEKPMVCPRCGLSGGKFELLKEKSVYVDWQKIVVQERPEETPGGQLPRSIEVRLTRDLVDVTRPGDRISIVGVVRLSQDSRTKPYFTPFIDAISVDVSQKMLEEVVITREDEERIRELASDPWIVHKVMLSIAPSLYGLWDEKESIAYLLFGGVQKHTPDGVRRGDIHVLLVGDPGTGKSQLLQSAIRLAPRGIYTSGKGSTAAGLTAAVLRDTTTGEWYLEAGALVIADGGVAAIDEIDKMREEDRSAIHEAMEQQTVSIAKAGIIASLNSRTSVLAAGNPKFGRYDKNLSIAENLGLPAPIISRFDLIWLLLDIPNEALDKKLARYVLGVHQDVDKVSLELDPVLLKKYISYARRYVRPRISRSAAELIEDFFVKMRMTVSAKMSERNMNPADIPIPITTRQLEALIRITEAHAKMRLKSVADEEDAEAAIRLVYTFLRKLNIEVGGEGEIDISELHTGVKRSKIELMRKILSLIRELESESPRKCALHDDLKERIAELKIDEQAFEEALRKLQAQGQIYFTTVTGGKRCYRRVD